ncbi:hypothetical protein HZA33_01210 [Candidatus Pacearchaeota archaeon]|nr:hypothetical protein [Candidatus Pacearchaeota archaeon]
MAEKEVIKANILLKLFRRGKIGGAHTELRNAMKGMKENPKEVKKAVEELNKEGFLSAKQSTGEIHVSLNSHRIQEIKEYISKWLDILIDLL